METISSECKVLPFTGALGKVPGHAVLRYMIDGAWPERVCIKSWDDVAELMVEHSVHVSEWTKYMHKRSPAIGEVVAVLLNNGRRIAASTMHCAHHDLRSVNAAPVLTRLPFLIVALYSSARLVEVAGVQQWCYSRREPQDAGLILDPWARDAADFHARMDAARAAS